MKKEERVFQLEELTAQKDVGAILVAGENAVERKEVCKKCTHATDLTGVIPMIKIMGCGICKCPFSTKPHFKKHFSIKMGSVIKTECPHPDGNKWEEVDRKFL